MTLAKRFLPLGLAALIAASATAAPLVVQGAPAQPPKATDPFEVKRPY